MNNDFQLHMSRILEYEKQLALENDKEACGYIQAKRDQSIANFYRQLSHWYEEGARNNYDAGRQEVLDQFARISPDVSAIATGAVD
jgi:hypothetical protein